MIIIVENIDWDFSDNALTDQQVNELLIATPNTIILEVNPLEATEEIEEYISETVSDRISDISGYCHLGGYSHREVTIEELFGLIFDTIAGAGLVLKMEGSLYTIELGDSVPSEVSEVIGELPERFDAIQLANWLLWTKNRIDNA